MCFPGEGNCSGWYTVLWSWSKRMPKFCKQLMNPEGILVLCHWCYPHSWLWKLWMKHFIQGPKICRAQALGFSFLLDRAGTAHPNFFFSCCFFLCHLLSSSSEVTIQRSPRKCLVVSERRKLFWGPSINVKYHPMIACHQKDPSFLHCLFIYTAKSKNSQVINLYKHTK